MGHQGSKRASADGCVLSGMLSKEVWLSQVGSDAIWEEEKGLLLLEFPQELSPNQ